jgi:hypothetical protein
MAKVKNRPIVRKFAQSGRPDGATYRVGVDSQHVDKNLVDCLNVDMSIRRLQYFIDRQFVNVIKGRHINSLTINQNVDLLRPI